MFWGNELHVDESDLHLDRSRMSRPITKSGRDESLVSLQRRDNLDSAFQSVLIFRLSLIVSNSPERVVFHDVSCFGRKCGHPEPNDALQPPLQFRLRVDGDETTHRVPFCEVGYRCDKVFV